MTRRHVQQSAKRSALAIAAMAQAHLDEFRDAVTELDIDAAEHSLTMLGLALGDIEIRLPMIAPAKDDFAFAAGVPSGDGAQLGSEPRPLTGLPVEVLGYSRLALAEEPSELITA